MKRVVKGFVVAALLTGVPLIGSPLQTNAALAVFHHVNQSQQTLKQSIAAAKVGRVINSEHFGVGSKKKDIERKWGKPQVVEGNYFEYSKRKVSFSYDKKDKAMSVYTSDKRVLSLKFEDVKKALGSKLIDEDHGAGQTYQTYKVGKYYLVLHWGNDGSGMKLVEWVVRNFK